MVHSCLMLFKKHGLMTWPSVNTIVTGLFSCKFIYFYFRF